MHKPRALFLLLACASMAGPAFAEMPQSSNGQIVDSSGATLYTFDKDTKDKSTCEASCATNWPPAMAGAQDKASGDWSIISRSDGQRQWSYKGHPLYRYAKDKKPGDAMGDGARGIWHVAKP